MKFSGKQLIEFLGVSAVVLSLLFVGFELRLARSLATSQSFYETSELTRNLNELIIANADIWARGCMADELPTSEAVVYEFLVHSLINYEWTRWSRSRAELTGSPLNLGARPLGRNIYNFPGIRTAWENAPQKGSSAFQQAVLEEYQLLEDSGSERNLDVSLCGK